MEKERKHRKSIIGIVTSDKMDKTLVVTVSSYKVHPIYKKRVRYRKKYHVHDELNQAAVGDRVEIMETRPLSATKRFRLVKIVEKHNVITGEVS